MVQQEELARIANVKYTPVIFQEYVEAVYDLRITVIGHDVFPAAIHFQQSECRNLNFRE